MRGTIRTQRATAATTMATTAPTSFSPGILTGRRGAAAPTPTSPWGTVPQVKAQVLALAHPDMKATA